MRDKPATGVVPSPAVFINAQSAITGLRGRDLISTLRSVAAHGLRNPIHSAKHALKLGGQLGRVLLGETLHPTNPQDSRFADPAWSLNPFYRRSLQAYLAWQKQVKSWIDESSMSDDRRRLTQSTQRSQRIPGVFLSGLCELCVECSLSGGR